ncbi:helix-turn-helix domain-containing protein [Fusobacteria bacterium ZRK30]|nr:helix-turn-helix domain-containing protein [Fusobacteria bacterium ZRK30]
MFTVEQFKGTVYENGFGMIPKKIMCDRDLSSNAKLLYAFLASHSFNGSKATPKKTTINHLLGWGESRTDKALKELKLRGLIQVEKYLIPASERTNPKQRYRNHYVLTNSLADVIEISVKETKKEEEKQKEPKIETVKKDKKNKQNKKNDTSSGDLNQEDSNFDKELKETLETSNFKNLNLNTIKNIKKSADGSLEEVKKVIKYMKSKGKPMSPDILIAILRDKDHLVPKAERPKKLTRKEKAEIMIKELGSKQIEKLRKEIADETGFPKESEDVKTFLESHLCSMFKNNYRD